MAPTLYSISLSFSRHILQISESISDMGDVSWQIVLSLVLAWIIVYLCLIKGVASSGKVSVAITALCFCQYIPFQTLSVVTVESVVLTDYL